jgi:hypothetical protein
MNLLRGWWFDVQAAAQQAPRERGQCIEGVVEPDA